MKNSPNGWFKSNNKPSKSRIHTYWINNTNTANDEWAFWVVIVLNFHPFSKYRLALTLFYFTTTLWGKQGCSSPFYRQGGWRRFCNLPTSQGWRVELGFEFRVLGSEFSQVLQRSQKGRAGHKVKKCPRAGGRKNNSLLLRVIRSPVIAERCPWKMSRTIATKAPKTQVWEMLSG